MGLGGGEGDRADTKKTQPQTNFSPVWLFPRSFVVVFLASASIWGQDGSPTALHAAVPRRIPADDTLVCAAEAQPLCLPW